MFLQTNIIETAADSGRGIVNILKDSLSGTFDKTAEFLPTLLSALVVLFIGWIIARAVKWALTKVLRAVKFDSLADKVGINGYLQKGGIKKNSSGLLATLGYWVIMFTVLVTFFNTLGLDVVSNLLNDVILYIPNIIVGIILLVVGMYLAEFISSLVVASLKGGGFEYAEMAGRIAYGAIMFFALALVLNQIGIGKGIIDTVVGVVVGGAGLAFALAFGLGGRDWAAKVMNNIFKG